MDRMIGDLWSAWKEDIADRIRSTIPSEEDWAVFFIDVAGTHVDAAFLDYMHSRKIEVYYLPARSTGIIQAYFLFGDAVTQ